MGAERPNDHRSCSDVAEVLMSKCPKWEGDIKFGCAWLLGVHRFSCSSIQLIRGYVEFSDRGSLFILPMVDESLRSWLLTRPLPSQLNNLRLPFTISRFHRYVRLSSATTSTFFRHAVEASFRPKTFSTTSYNKLLMSLKKPGVKSHRGISEHLQAPAPNAGNTLNHGRFNPPI